MSYVNKKLSILADSISTFEGYNNDINSNTTIGNNRVYYGGIDHSGSTYITDVNKTWWKMLVNETNMELVVNNSWSGSLVFDKRIEACGYASRCFNLHNDHNNNQPEIIFVYLGTNDAHQDINVGTYIKEEIDEFLKNEKMPSTFIEAYALMLHNIKRKYQQSEDILNSLLGYTLLSKYLNDDFGYTNKNLTYNEFGKPYLKDIYFSISHSHNMIALIISNEECGIDIEYIDKDRNYDLLSKKILSDNEYDIYINELQKEEYFITCWTKKEAFLKSLGTGIIKSKLSEVDENINSFKIVDGNNKEYIISIYSKESFNIKKDCTI